MRAEIGVLAKVDAELTGLEIKDGLLVTTMEVPIPVPWKIITHVSRMEAWKALWMGLKPSIIIFLLFGIGRK